MEFKQYLKKKWVYILVGLALVVMLTPRSTKTSSEYPMEANKNIGYYVSDIDNTLSEGNAWARKASMIIAVFTKKELDCVIGSREFYLFDTGMATAQMILRATELNLVMHPIAGYSHSKAKEILAIPEEMILITL